MKNSVLSVLVLFAYNAFAQSPPSPNREISSFYGHRANASGNRQARRELDTRKDISQFGHVHLVKWPSLDEPLQPRDTADKKRTNWHGVLVETTTFLSIQTAWRIATKEETRQALKGPFFKDWARSIRIRGWDDGDKLLINWVFHPLEGAIWAEIFRHNNEQSRNAVFGWNKDYRNAKFKQFLFAVAGSEMFEFFTPLSEAAVGVYPEGKVPGAIDHVVTPVMGITWSIGEDAVDHYVARPLLSKSKRIPLKLLVSTLTPTRFFMNVLRLKPPWHRE